MRISALFPIFVFWSAAVVPGLAQSPDTGGRRSFYDPHTNQLTVIDSPENLDRVRTYLQGRDAMPPNQGQGRMRSAVLPLRHQSASEMVDLLQRARPVTAATHWVGSPIGPERGGGAADLSRTRALAAGSELVLRDLRLKLVRINGNDPRDENDDEVVVLARTATQSQELLIRELRIGHIEDYEIHVLNVVPSRTDPGKGDAKIQARYVGTGR